MNLTSQSKKKVKVAVVDRGLDCALPESDGWVVSDQDIKGKNPSFACHKCG
jgi:hypothetical protein